MNLLPSSNHECDIDTITTPCDGTKRGADSLLSRLLDQLILLPEEWEEIPVKERIELASLHDKEELLNRLANHRLLIAFSPPFRSMRSGAGSNRI